MSDVHLTNVYLNTQKKREKNFKITVNELCWLELHKTLKV